MRSPLTVKKSKKVEVGLFSVQKKEKKEKSNKDERSVMKDYFDENEI
jgi:hypothetical protein